MRTLTCCHKGAKPGKLTEDKICDSSRLKLYKELNGLIPDSHIGEFRSVTFPESGETHVGFVERRSNVRKVGEDEPYWEVHFEDTTTQAIPFGNGLWEWDYVSKATK